MRGRAAALLALACAACTYFYVSSDGLVIIGFVWESGGGVVVIQSPDTVRAGVAFDAVVRTSGNSCTRAERTTVELDGLVARITPYDRVEDRDGCTPDVTPVEHPVTITFPKPGEGALEVRGRARNASGIAVDTVVRHPVTIR